MFKRGFTVKFDAFSAAPDFDSALASPKSGAKVALRITRFGGMVA
jgi:hypothetical protein